MTLENANAIDALYGHHLTPQAMVLALAVASAMLVPLIATLTPSPSQSTVLTPRWPCIGDCNFDNLVSVDEIITGVSIALGLTTKSRCVPFDRNLDDAVTAEELIAAIDSALQGCRRGASALNGEFLCSGGLYDGFPCAGNDDCPGGVCVIAQGICSNDTFICNCPSGTCSNQGSCPEDQSFATCSGGVSPGLCCEMALNCHPGDACVGTQRVYVGGLDQGFFCLTDDHCRGGRCTSTGCFCDGSDYDAYTCVSSRDCPGGGTCSCLQAKATRLDSSSRSNVPHDTTAKCAGSARRAPRQPGKADGSPCKS